MPLVSGFNPIESVENITKAEHPECKKLLEGRRLLGSFIRGRWRIVDDLSTSELNWRNMILIWRSEFSYRVKFFPIMPTIQYSVYRRWFLSTWQPIRYFPPASNHTKALSKLVVWKIATQQPNAWNSRSLLAAATKQWDKIDFHSIPLSLVPQNPSKLKYTYQERTEFTQWYIISIRHKVF